MSLPRFDSSASSAEVAQAVDRHGVAIIERLVPDDICDVIDGELRPWIDRTPTGTGDFDGTSTRRTGALLARSATAVDMIAHPLVLEVVDLVLGDQKTAFQLHLTQAISLEPGAPAQGLHRDQWCFDFFEFPTEMNVEVSTIWALTDFTEENGATLVVPDSHRSTGMPHTEADAVQASMPRGSIVIYTGATVHGGGANRSDARRVAVNVDYALGWLRQEENQYLSVPADTARALPERVQRLMGYAKGGFALGYIDDVRDPLCFLDPARASGPSFAAEA